MEANNCGKIRVALLLLLCLGLSAPALAGSDPLELQVWPDVVEIGAFFSGHEVKISGIIPQGAQAVVEIIGPTGAEHLMRKGRRGGLWMNVGELEVDGAPSLYLAASTTPALLKAPPAEAVWGYPALKKQIRFAGEVKPEERDMFLDQFFQLKESDEIFGAFPGTLKLKEASQNLQTVAGTISLPTKVRPGAYRVSLTVVQGSQVIAQQDRELKVVMVGFPAMLASLAYEHGLTYGILAVIIAIVTGFAMGYLFKGGGGH
jgi:hypothetical protein